MSGFRDIRLPVGVKGYPTSGAARFSTTITAVSSGAEHRNQNWQHPLFRFNLAEAVRDQETFEAAQRHWMAMRGPFYTFPFLDPLDFASAPLPAPNFAPPISGTDIEIGVGDFATREFRLIKKYTVAGSLDEETYSRRITLPILETVVVLIDGLDPATDNPVTMPGGPYSYEVSRPGGVISFNKPLDGGLVVTAGFLFEVPVRFEADDTFEGVVRNYRVAGFADIVLLETRPC